MLSATCKFLFAKAQALVNSDDAEGDGKNEKPMSDEEEKIQLLCEDFIIEIEIQDIKKSKADEEKENGIKGAALRDNLAIRAVLGEVSIVGGKKVSFGDLSPKVQKGNVFAFHSSLL